MNPLMNTAEVADLLGVTLPYVQRLAREGQLEGFALNSGGRARVSWRFTREAVERWLEQQRSTTTAGGGR